MPGSESHATRNITLSVDTSRLFDALSDMGGDISPLGCRIVEALLAPSGTRLKLGLGVYGITLTEEGGIVSNDRANEADLLAMAARFDIVPYDPHARRGHISELSVVLRRRDPEAWAISNGSAVY